MWLMAAIRGNAELESSLSPVANLKMTPNYLEGVANPCLSSRFPFILNTSMKAVLFLSALPLP